MTRSYVAVENVILEVMGTRFNNPGDSFKMRHEVRYNGDECTPENKSPAMTVTRYTDCWKWYCHRCKDGGVIDDNNMSPAQTAHKLQQRKRHIPEEAGSFDVPPDSILLSTPYMTPVVPLAAYQWLDKYGIKSTEMWEYNIGWSQQWQRVIIPIHENMYDDPIAWVGRDPYTRTKDERVEAQIPKYLTIKPKGVTDRVYFKTKGKEERKGITVIVEDQLSAIKVNRAFKCNTIALLNAGVSDELIKACRGTVTIIWLDSDMKLVSMKAANRFRSLGVVTKHLGTEKDPKCYTDRQIQSYLNPITGEGE